MSITSFYTTLSILSVLAVSFSASAALELQLANAQNATSVNFLSYQNPILGFSIKHPADWKVHESDYDKGAVEFKTSDDDTIFFIDIENVTQYLDTNTLTLKNASLLEEVKVSQEEHSSIASDFKLIRQNEVTVAGNTGIKQEYLASGLYWFNVFTIIDGKLYTFSYHEEPGNVPKTVQLANKMVETFQITR